MSFKGRGAAGNPANRYHSTSVEAVDDGWEPDEPTVPVTSVQLHPAKTIVSYNDSPDIPFDRSVNPYQGCEHGCIYCYARPSHSYWGYSAGLDFETKLIAKPNAATLLREALCKRGYQAAPLCLGSNTDIYQPIERSHGLTRACLEVLLEALALVQRELVHHQPANVASDEFAVQALQALLVDRLDRMPVQAGELCDLRNRQQLAQRLGPGAQPLGDPAAPIQPGNVLDRTAAAVMAIHPPDRYVEPYPPIETIALAHPAAAAFVDQHARSAAVTTPGRDIRGFSELDEQRPILGFAASFDPVPFPERQGQHSIRHGGGLAD